MTRWRAMARAINLALVLLTAACGISDPTPVATSTQSPTVSSLVPPATATSWAGPLTAADLDCLPNCTAAYLQRANLQGADLTGASLSGAYLRLADLRGTTLMGADLHWAQLDGANLAGANLGGALLRGANLRAAFPDNQPCPGEAQTAAEIRIGGACRADLRGANLRGADLRDVDLSQALLTGADLRQANLEGAALVAAKLQEANLELANLRGADVRGADLTGASLLGADLYDADLKDTRVSADQLAEAQPQEARLPAGRPLHCTRQQPTGLAGPIWDIEPAPDGTVWVAAFEGLARFEGKPGRWRIYDLTDILGGARVRSITAARDGTVWFALRLDAGSVRFDGRLWTQFGSDDGLMSDEVNQISVAPDGSVWFATRAGASRWEPESESWTSFSGLGALAGGPVWNVLFTPDGKIWFAQQRGLTSWLPAPEERASTNGTVEASPEPTAEGEPEESWESLDEFAYLGNSEAQVGGDGRLWLAHRVYDPDTGEWQATVYDELQLYDLAPDSYGGLWIARRDGALYIPDPLSSPKSDWRLFGEAEGLPSDEVTALALEGDGVIWFGTEAGLARCEVPTGVRSTPTPP